MSRARSPQVLLAETSGGGIWGMIPEPVALLDIKSTPPFHFRPQSGCFQLKRVKEKTIQFHLSFPESTKHHPVSNVRAKPVKFISSCSPKTVLRIGLLYTNKNGGDFDAHSVTKRNCAAPISKVESHISNRCIHNIYIPDCFWCWHEKQFGVVWSSIALD